MKRYRKICSICLAVALFLGGAIVAQGGDISGTYNAATSFSDGDTWTSGHVTINGVTVNVPNGATVTYNAVGKNLYGTSPGTFLIDAGGIFKMATTGGSDNLIVSGPVKILNEGTFDFASGGDIQLSNSGSAFENTGTLLKSVSSLGSSGNPSYIFPASTTSGGDFFNDGGTIQVDAGQLEIIGGSSNGGDFITSGSGQIWLSGRWTEVTGTASGKVYIKCTGASSVSGNEFVAWASTTPINMGGDGVTWVEDDINTNSNTLQNEGLFTINLAAVGTENLKGGGTFLNASGGTLDVQYGTVNLTGGTAFENEGTMNFTTSNTKGFSGSGTVLNKSGATADWQEGTIDLGASVTLRNEGTFNLTTAATKTLSGTGTFENASGGTMNWEAGQLTLDNGLTNKGTFNLTTSDTKTLSGTGTFENASGATMNWLDGQLTLNNDLVNEGTFEYSNGTSNVNTNLAGSGDFVNNGTFTHSATGNDNIIGSGSGSFVNNGLFDFTNAGDFEITDNYTFTNSSGGTIRKTAGAATLFFHSDTAGTGGTFDNQGTVEVLAGKIEILGSGSSYGTTVDLVCPQYDKSTKTLSGGTWAIRSTGASSTLDFQLAADGIQTIGAGATVELSGASSYFPQLTGDVTTVAGTLTINDRTFAASDFGSGAITLSGGTIDGTGQVNLGNNVNSSGTSTIGVATLDLGGATRTLNVTSGTTTVSSAIQNGGLTKDGGGILTLSGTTDNTYTGQTTVSRGRLRMQKSSADAVAGDILVNGGTLDWGGSNQVADTASITLDSGVLQTESDTVKNVTVNGTNAGGQTWIHKLTITDTLTITGGLPFLGSSTTTYAEKVVMTTGGEIEMAANAGPTTMNIGSGGLSMSDAVWHLGLQGSSSLPLDSSHTALINLGGDFTGSGTNSIEYFNTNGARLLDLQGATRTFDITDGTTTIDATIQNGGLSKDGVGTLVLNGANTYAGDTTVIEGLLEVNGTHTSGGTYTVQDGGTLGGTGTIGSEVIVQSGGTLHPGSSPGTIYLAALSMEPGSILDIEMSSTAIGFVDVAGHAHLDGLIQFDFVDGFVAAHHGTYDILTAASIELTPGYGLDQSAFSGGGMQFDWSIVDGGNGQILRLMTVPEPATLLIWSLLAGLGIGLRWRRRR